MAPIDDPFYTVPLIRLTIGNSIVYKLMLETQNMISQLDIGPSCVTNAPANYVNYSRLDDLIEEPPYMITFANLLGRNGRLLAMPYSTEKEHDYHRLLGKRCISHDLSSGGLELPGLRIEFIRPSHFAVLFGYGNDLSGTENDIQRLGRELAYRGFQLAYFHGEAASKENILDAIRYAARSSQQKQIAVVGSGHGNIGFIGVRHAYLEIKEVFDALGEDHDSLVVLDSCYGGKRMSNIPRNIYFIASEALTHEISITESQLGQSVASSGNLMMGQVISEVVSAFTLVRGTNHELTTADIGIMVSSVEDLDALCKGKNFNLPKTGCQVSVERQ